LAMAADLRHARAQGRRLGLIARTTSRAGNKPAQTVEPDLEPSVS
jgi:hypothetical protein